MTTRRFLLTTYGKAAHSGLAPEEGISAILEMAHVVQAALQLSRADRQVWVESVQGGLRPNVVAPECRAWIAVEAAGNSGIEAFRAALAAAPPVLSGARLTVQGIETAADRPATGRQAVAVPATASVAAPRRRSFAPRAPATQMADRPSSGVAAEISTYLSGRQSEMLSLLTELAALETPSSQPETQRAAFDLLARELAVAGYDATWWPGRRAGGLLLARPQARQRGAPVQLLLGHCDTVWPVGTLGTMPLRLADGRLNGPGVFDMKGGLVQAVFALQSLSALGLRPPATPVLLVNSDEEIGSGESTRTIERLARIACRAFIMEPALGQDGKLKTARKGVGQFRVSLSAGQSDGSAVALELARLIRALSDLNDLSGGITINVGLVLGGGEAPGPMRDAELVVDARVPNAEAARRVEEVVYALRPAQPGVALETSGRVTRMPLERTARNQALWRTAQRLGSELGLALAEGAAGGASDGNTASQFTATLDGLGAVGDGAHALHEHILVDALAVRAALLAMLLLSPLWD